MIHEDQAREGGSWETKPALKMQKHFFYKGSVTLGLNGTRLELT